jgi:sugar/nucleoside kinase (ribokinase family)
MPPEYDIYLVGSYNLDLIFTGLPRMPQLGLDTIGTGFDVLPGESYTSAVAMHRLGLNVAWAADFGNDRISALALEFIRREKLDETYFVFHDRPFRRVTAAASLAEERGFMTYYDPDPPVLAAMKYLMTVKAKAVYIPGIISGAMFSTASRVLKMKKMKIIMDGNANSNESIQNPAIRDVLRTIDVLLPNARETRMLTGEEDLEKAMLAINKLCKLVIVKDGKNGAYACENGSIIHEPSIAVTPLDTTGAGDCFSAGFTAAWLKGKPLNECLRWGNIVGALSTLKIGGTGQVITVEDVRQNLEQVYHQSI